MGLYHYYSRTFRGNANLYLFKTIKPYLRGKNIFCDDFRF
jgi:hypothetical protein